jgi:hypothetical protein
LLEPTGCFWRAGFGGFAPFKTQSRFFVKARKLCRVAASLLPLLGSVPPASHTTLSKPVHDLPPANAPAGTAPPPLWVDAAAKHTNSSFEFFARPSPIREQIAPPRRPFDRRTLQTG